MIPLVYIAPAKAQVAQYIDGGTPSLYHGQHTLLLKTVAIVTPGTYPFTYAA